MERSVDHDAHDGVVTLRFHGDPAVSGHLEPASGTMVWTTDGDPDAEVAGEFAVIDGVVVMRYAHAGTSWLRLGPRLVPWDDAWVSIEEGLSARELVVELGDDMIRLRAEGDPVAVSFAITLADASAIDHQVPLAEQATLFN
jgi:hypothetical protein